MRSLDFSLRTKVPEILQSESAECGLACVAMIAGHFGHEIDLTTLRRQYAMSAKGAKLTDLLVLGDQLHLSGRAIRCELEEFSALRLPAVLHWKLNHFVVLVRVSKSHIWIHDPASGKQKVNLQDCSAFFSGVAVEWQPQQQFEKRQENHRLSIRQLWHRVTHLYRTIALLVFLSLLLQVVAVFAPYYMQWVVDHVLTTADRDLLFVLALGFGLMMLIGAGVSALRSWVVLRLASTMNLQLGANLLSHLLRLPLEFFHKRHVGDVVSRFSSLTPVRERMTTGVVEAVVDGVMSIMMLSIMLLYSVHLTILVVIAVFVYILVRAATYQSFYRENEKVILAGATEQTNFLENIRGIQTIKAMAAEPARIAMWQNHYAKVINNEIKLGKMNIGFGFASSLIFGVENILVVYFAAKEVIALQLTIGMVLAFMAYKGQLTSRLIGLVEQWISFRMLRLHLNRLADIALTEAEPQQLPKAIHGPHVIELKNLGFQYGDNEPAVISGLSLKIKPGSMLAVVGPSGGGKSTLVKLLLGLLAPSEGQLLCDDQTIQCIGVQNYRRSVAAVLQDDVLLSGSVTDNISFFALEPNPEKIELCARRANIHSDIVNLPMGYESLVGDMGSVFSGGQVQRLLLARALYRDPQVLVLDEATSHLDVDNEAIVTDCIAGLRMTRIVVAHRPSTIQSADQILLLKDGRGSSMQPQEYFRGFVENARPAALGPRNPEVSPR